MTQSEINGIKFQRMGHLSMADYHTSTYKAVNTPFDLLMSVKVPTKRYDEDGKRLRTSTRFFLHGRWYTKKQLYKELQKL